MGGSIELISARLITLQVNQSCFFFKLFSLSGVVVEIFKWRHRDWTDCTDESSFRQMIMIRQPETVKLAAKKPKLLLLFGVGVSEFDAWLNTGTIFQIPILLINYSFLYHLNNQTAKFLFVNFIIPLFGGNIDWFEILNLVIIVLISLENNGCINKRLLESMKPAKVRSWWSENKQTYKKNHPLLYISI